jgi:hypothetical protein
VALLADGCVEPLMMPGAGDRLIFPPTTCTTLLVLEVKRQTITLAYYVRVLDFGKTGPDAETSNMKSARFVIPSLSTVIPHQQSRTKCYTSMLLWRLARHRSSSAHAELPSSGSQVVIRTRFCSEDKAATIASSPRAQRCSAYSAEVLALYALGLFFVPDSSSLTVGVEIRK